MAEQIEVTRQDVKFENVVLNPSIPKIYANGFTVGYTSADAHVVLQLQGIPQAGISMSLAAAKSLHLILGKLIESYEQKTGQKVIDTIETQKTFARKP
jgi:hypothetical protein